MAKRELQALRPPLFALALLFCGAAATVMGMTQTAEGAGIRTGNAPASVSAQSTLIFLPDDAPDYDSPDLCAKLGGTLRAASGDQRVCSSVDANDTFCIVGSADAFPCQGLYKHALVCNQYNRPALNPFFCGAKCAAGEFACGAGCARGSIPPIGRIPYVAGDYAGEVFQAEVAATLSSGRATVALPLGKARFDLTLASSALSIAAVGTVAAVGVVSSVLAGSEHVGVLRADFSCGGLANSFSAAEAGFTVTALAAQPTLTAYFEAEEGSWGGAAFSISGVEQLTLTKTGGHARLRVSLRGDIAVDSPRPTIGSAWTLYATGRSAEIAGLPTLTARVEFHHPFSPVFGPNHCRSPDNPSNDTKASAKLLKALDTEDESKFCEALRNGANRNALRQGFMRQDINVYPTYPLMLAAALNRVDLGRTLTLNGADIHKNNENNPGGGPLNYAAYYGSVEYGEWLITEGGVDVNAVSGRIGKQQSPVHLLASRPSVAPGDPKGFAELLIEHRVDPNAHVLGASVKEPARYISILTDRHAPSDLLLKPLINYSPDHRSLPPLLDARVAPSNPHPLDPYYTVSSGDNKGLLPLTKSVMHDYVQMVSVFLEGPGAVDANRLNPLDGLAALHYARSSLAVQLLYDGGASVNVSTSISGTAIFLTPLDLMVFKAIKYNRENFSGAEFEPLLQVIVLMNQLGGKCLAAEKALGLSAADAANAAVLCNIGGSDVPGQNSGIAFTTEAVCGRPHVMGGGGNSFYLSVCHLECSADGYQTGRTEERYCTGAANVFDDSGDLDDAALERVRVECKSRALAEPGLSCANVTLTSLQ